MAISGSYNFELKRNQLVEQAFKKCGLLPKGQSLAAEDLNEGITLLNMMVKSWASKDIYLWKYETIALFPQYGQYKYIISPSTTDHATTSYNRTTASVAASSGASTIEVSSATGFANTYNIGVELSTGYLQWTTITNVSSTTITLNDALTSDVNSGATVYVYQSLAQKPLKCKYATVIDSDENETEISVVARKDYRTLANKTNVVDLPSEIMFEPRRSESFIWVSGASGDVSKVILLDTVYPFADFDSLNDDADFPSEWTDTLVYNLAKRLVVDYGVTGERAARIDSEADRLFADLLDYDMEDTYLQVDVAIKKPYTRRR